MREFFPDAKQAITTHVTPHNSNYYTSYYARLTLLRTLLRIHTTTHMLQDVTCLRRTQFLKGRSGARGGARPRPHARVLPGRETGTLTRKPFMSLRIHITTRHYAYILLQILQSLRLHIITHTTHSLRIHITTNTTQVTTHAYSYTDASGRVAIFFFRFIEGRGGARRGTCPRPHARVLSGRQAGTFTRNLPNKLLRMHITTQMLQAVTCLY